MSSPHPLRHRGRRRRQNLLGRRASSRGRASPPAAPTSRISRGGSHTSCFFCTRDTVRALVQTPPRRATRGSSRGAGTGRRLSRPPYRSLPRAGQRKLRWLGTRGQPLPRACNLAACGCLESSSTLRESSRLPFRRRGAPRAAGEASGFSLEVFGPRRAYRVLQTRAPRRPVDATS